MKIKRIMIIMMVMVCLGCSAYAFPKEITISKMYSSNHYKIPFYKIPSVMSLLSNDYELVSQENYQHKTSSIELRFQIDGKKYGITVVNDNVAKVFAEDEVYYLRYNQDCYQKLIEYID